MKKPDRNVVGVRIAAVSKVVAVGLLFLVSSRPPEAVAGEKQGAAAHPTKATLSAAPNPVPVPVGGGLGATTVSWDTGDGSVGEVYLYQDGSPEMLFARSPKGSQVANWISPKATYEFRLYAGTQHLNRLATVKVTTK